MKKEKQVRRKPNRHDGRARSSGRVGGPPTPQFNTVVDTETAKKQAIPKLQKSKQYRTQRSWWSPAPFYTFGTNLLPWSPSAHGNKTGREGEDRGRGEKGKRKKEKKKKLVFNFLFSHVVHPPLCDHSGVTND